MWGTNNSVIEKKKKERRSGERHKQTMLAVDRTSFCFSFSFSFFSCLVMATKVILFLRERKERKILSVCVLFLFCFPNSLQRKQFSVGFNFFCFLFALFELSFFNFARRVQPKEC